MLAIVIIDMQTLGVLKYVKIDMPDAIKGTFTGLSVLNVDVSFFH